MELAPSSQYSVEDIEAMEVPPSRTQVLKERMMEKKKTIAGILAMTAVVGTVIGVVASGSSSADAGTPSSSSSTPKTDAEMLQAFQEAGEYCGIFPSKIVTIKGSYDEAYQGVNSLKQKDMVGNVHDPWENYIEFVLDANKLHESEIEFELPSWLVGNYDLVKGVALDVNFMGETGEFQRWGVELRNQDRKVWDPLWDNNEVAMWAWDAKKATRSIVLGEFQDYIIGDSNKVSTRLISRENVLFNSLFDYMSLCVTVEAGVVEPTPAPVPAPVEVDNKEMCYYPSKIKPVVGKPLGYMHSAANLKDKELKGSEDNWYAYVEFGSEPTAGIATYEFEVPVRSDLFPETLVGLRAYLNYRGPDLARQRWYLQIKDLSENKWYNILDNKNANSWTWSELIGTHPVKDNNPLRFVQNDGEGDSKWKTVTLRWNTDADVDASQIDFARLCMVGEFDDFPDPYAPTPRPTPAPVPTGPTPEPTPKPTFSPVAAGECYNRRNPSFEEWNYQGGICGIYTFDRSDKATRDQTLLERSREGCSTIMLDPQLSYYMPESEFDLWVTFMDDYAKEALELGMKMVVYYPTLEIVSKNIDTVPSAGTVMADWLQLGLNGKPNKFVGGLEHWVEEGEESAWFDPESPYVDYFINRCKKIAGTAIAGLWGDVPLYYETGASWAGGSTYSATAFKAWSNERGLCPQTNGCALPDYAPLENWDFSQLEFHYWVIWRHHSLAGFLDKVRKGIQSVKPTMSFFVENYPSDYVDGALVGLDASYFTEDMRQGMSTVWETDSVSNQNAMEYAHPEDMANQITMRKFGRGADKSSPTWSFAYGNKAVDSSHVVSGAFAVGTNPLETKTPYMTSTVDSSYRERYFNWVKENSCQVMQTDRVANAAILYSSPTRDHVDLSTPYCGYSMYLVTDPTPASDSEWWANSPFDTMRGCPHIGQYRGASYGLQLLHVPFKIVIDMALEPSDLEGIKFLWLPNTVSLPAKAINVIKEWVRNGGTLFATGAVPGSKDEYGRAISPNPLEEVFGRLDLDSYTQPYGRGVAYLKKAFDSRDFFTQQGGSAQKQSAALDFLEQLVRIHVPDHFAITNGAKHVFVEQSVPFNNEQHIYMFNYNGMQRPVKRAPQTIEFIYKPPAGMQVASYSVTTPDAAPAWNQDNISFERIGTKGWIKATVVVDVFSLLTFKFETLDEARSEARQQDWTNAEFKKVADEALDFIVDKMRDSSLEGAYKYGVFTNFIDTTDNDPLYAYGHHTTSEHMGLYLRAMACAGRKQAFQEGVSYVEEVMVSPLYKVINWAIDYKKKHAFMTYDQFENVWWSSTAPLDDFRTIQGLIEGSDKWSDQSTARTIAENALRAVYWTSISDRYRLVKRFPQFPGGIVGISFDWVEVNDPNVTPPSIATGQASLYDQHIAVNYQDIDMLHTGCEQVDPRFCQTLAGVVELMIQSQIPSMPGLFYNTYKEDGSWSGDWEYIGSTQESHLKVIQELWTAIHLAKAGSFDTPFITPTQRVQAKQAADRSFEWFKSFYINNGNRIPEYVTVSGGDVPDCNPVAKPLCLDRRWDNSFVGEPRIYALLVRLGYLLGKDRIFLEAVIKDKIIPDRVTDTSDPRFGSIGVSALSDGRESDADAWNSLEPVLTMCMLDTGF